MLMWSTKHASSDRANLFYVQNKLHQLLNRGLSTVSSAILIDRGNGLIYDDVLDITWLQDADAGGFHFWPDAVVWAAGLVFPLVNGFDDWRLPSMSAGRCLGRPCAGASSAVVSRGGAYGICLGPKPGGQDFGASVIRVRVG